MTLYGYCLPIAFRAYVKLLNHYAIIHYNINILQFDTILQTYVHFLLSYNMHAGMDA